MLCMRDERTKIIGNNIKAERKKQKLTQLKLSILSNISVESVIEIEQGRQTPSSIVLYDIAKALDVPLIDLYKDFS